MANTTNFGWETPDDTDLVKDGALAMRTLGNAIDTSLVDLKGGTTNQILAKNSNTDMDFKWVANDVGDITEISAGSGISITNGTGPIPTVAVDSTVIRTTGGQVIAANSSTNALEIRQTGSGNALVIEDDTNPDSTPFVVAADGRVAIGATAPATTLYVYAASNSSIQNEGDAGTNNVIQRNSTDTTGPTLQLRKARGTTASKSTVSSGDNIGTIIYQGFDGTNNTTAVQLVGSVDAAPSTGVMPGRFTISTNNASGVATQRLRFDSAGRITGLNSSVLDIPLVTNAQTTSYTLVLADGGRLVEVNNAGATTLTIPLNSSVAFATGTQINVLQTGAGQITVAGDVGVTVNGTPGLKLRAQWSAATLIKRDTNTWVVIGDLAA